MKALLPCVVYALIIAAVITMTWRAPEGNWDILPYMALAIEHDAPNPAALHAATYAEAQRLLPASTFAQLVDSTNVYRRRLYREPGTFNGELRYYRVKPLYQFLVTSCARIGIPLTTATIVPSLLGFLLLALWLPSWLLGMLPRPYGYIVALALVLSPFVLPLVRMSTPDLLTAGLLVVGTVALDRRRSPLAGLVLLALAAAVRIDAALYGFAMIAWLRIARGLALRWTLAATALLAAVPVIVLAGHPGLPGELLTRQTAADRISGGAAPSFFAAYRTALVQGMGGLAFSSLMPILGLAAVALFLRLSATTAVRADAAFAGLRGLLARRDPTAVLGALMLAHMLIRFLLHPVVEDRFLIADFIVIAVCAVRALVELLRARGVDGAAAAGE